MREALQWEKSNLERTGQDAIHVNRKLFEMFPPQIAAQYHLMASRNPNDGDEVAVRFPAEAAAISFRQTRPPGVIVTALCHPGNHSAVIVLEWRI